MMSSRFLSPTRRLATTPCVALLAASAVGCGDAPSGEASQERGSTSEANSESEIDEQGSAGASGQMSSPKNDAPELPKSQETDEPSDQENDPEDEENECTTSTDQVLRLGRGVGGAFEAFEPGDTLDVDFASQAGVYAHALFDLSGVAIEEIELVHSSLLVDGIAVAEAETVGNAFHCAGASARLEMIMPVHVVNHPTLPSLVELDGASGEVSGRVTLEDGNEMTKSIPVMINL